MAETAQSPSVSPNLNSEGRFQVFGFGYNGFTQFAAHKTVSEDGQTAPLDFTPEYLSTPLPLNVDHVSTIGASLSSTFYLKENGTVSIKGWIPGTKEAGELENLLPDYSVTDVCCSWMQIVFLTSEGDCVLWNNSTNDRSHPVKIEAKSTKFKAVGCTESNCILLTNGGQAGYAIHEQDQVRQDDSYSNKLPLIFKPMDITKQMTSVACGKEHALLLSSSGEVFSLGSGSRGQLGRGLIVKEQNAAVIPALEGIKIQFVAAGGWHSAAISEFGDLYMWGWNEKGQLGLAVNHDDADNRQSSSGQIQCQAVPVPVDIPDDLEVLTVSCGTRHTAAVAGDGSVWTWGWGYYGQLGHGDRANKYTPSQVAAFSSLKHKAKTLCCGDWSTFVITTKKPPV